MLLKMESHLTSPPWVPTHLTLETEAQMFVLEEVAKDLLFTGTFLMMKPLDLKRNSLSQLKWASVVLVLELQLLNLEH